MRDQAARAFGEEHLVTELDRRLHLAALDEVGMGFENRIELLGSWNLLAVEHTAARLIDHTGSQTTKVLDLLARFRDHHVGDHISAMRLAGIPQHHACALQNLLGNADELTIFPGLLLLTLPRCHPLDLQHPTPCRSCSIPEPLDTPASQRCCEARDQARDHAQRIAVGDPLPQFAIVPVLDAHQHQRTQHLLRRQATATGRGVLQASYQIASDPFDHVLLDVEKIGNSLQHRLKTQTLPHQLPIGKIDLSLYRPRHDSTLVALRSRALSLQCLDVARCRLVQQILQSPSVVQTALHLRNKLLRNVNRNATPLGAIVQDIALMLFARQTSRAVYANTPTATQAQRAKKRRPYNRSFTLKPAHDIRGRFRINTIHDKHVSIDTRTRQENRSRKLRETRYFKGCDAFRDRNGFKSCRGLLLQKNLYPFPFS